jgi:hypothetical protein
MGRTVKAACLGFTCAIAFLLLFEIAARALLPRQVGVFRRRAVGDDRVLFVSKSSYVDMVGYYKIAPEMPYTEVAYYPDMNGKASKEYECTYRSDRLGFLSNSVAYEDASILLLGDSFVQGQGGCEWLPRLREQTRAKIYSAAIQGHGFAHWEKIVSDLAGVRKPEKILVVFTTDDFFRAQSQVGQSQLACLDDITRCTNHYWYPIDNSMQELAQARLKRRHDGPDFFADPKTSLKAMFPASFGVLRMIAGYERAPVVNMANSRRIVAKFAKTFDTRLIWIRSREHTDEPREQVVASALRDDGLIASHCSLPSDGYLPRDGHPNSKGYDALRNCVEAAVAGW